MPVVPSAIERFLFSLLGLAPELILDIAASGARHAVAAAVRLGVFEALADGPRSVEEVAPSLRANPHSLEILLNALTDFRYLRRTRGRYENAPTTRRWLLARSSTSWADVARWWDELVFPFWQDHIDEAVRDGRPRETIYEWLSGVPAGWRIAQAAFRAYGRPIADPIAAAVEIPPNARRLLDIGGGHGLYSIAFCRRYGGLSATVFDFPGALDTARGDIKAARMEGRVNVQPGDYRTDSLGEGYDVALLFSILHAHRPEENLALLRKVASALNPGGIVVVLENLPGGPSRTARAIASHFSLTYLVALGGQTYRTQDISAWLTSAGFSPPRRVRVRKAAGFAILTARK